MQTNKPTQPTAAEALDAYRKMMDVLDFVDKFCGRPQGQQRSFKGVTQLIANKLMEMLVREKIDLTQLPRLDSLEDGLPKSKPKRQQRHYR